MRPEMRRANGDKAMKQSYFERICSVGGVLRDLLRHQSAKTVSDYVHLSSGKMILFTEIVNYLLVD